MICGFQKTTLLDYPGHLAATIFLGGCNFRCPFCQNGGLVLTPENEPPIPYEEVLQTLNKRKRILEGVCISGGEPTFSPELLQLITDIKKLGLLVKLDTNGSRPEVLRSLISDGLIDYVAMDIKSAPETYAAACGFQPAPLTAIRQSVELLMNGELPYEFRTTVVGGLHTREDFLSIRSWIGGCQSYYLQPYVDSEHVLSHTFRPPTDGELLDALRIVQETIPHAAIRGRELPAASFSDE